MNISVWLLLTAYVNMPYLLTKFQLMHLTTFQQYKNIDTFPDWDLEITCPGGGGGYQLLQ